MGSVPHIAIHNALNTQCPKVSIAQLWYMAFTFEWVKLGFHSSILDNQSFFFAIYFLWWIISIHVSVINHNLLLIHQKVYLAYFQIEKFNRLKNRWLTKKLWKCFHSVLPSPLSAEGWKTNFSKTAPLSVMWDSGEGRGVGAGKCLLGRPAIFP